MNKYIIKALENERRILFISKEPLKIGTNIGITLNFEEAKNFNSEKEAVNFCIEFLKKTTNEINERLKYSVFSCAHLFGYKFVIQECEELNIDLTKLYSLNDASGEFGDSMFSLFSVKKLFRIKNISPIYQFKAEQGKLVYEVIEEKNHE